MKYFFGRMLDNLIENRMLCYMHRCKMASSWLLYWDYTRLYFTTKPLLWLFQARLDKIQICDHSCSVAAFESTWLNDLKAATMHTLKNLISESLLLPLIINVDAWCVKLHNELTMWVMEQCWNSNLNFRRGPILLRLWLFMIVSNNSCLSQINHIYDWPKCPIFNQKARPY